MEKIRNIFEELKTSSIYNIYNKYSNESFVKDIFRTKNNFKKILSEAKSKQIERQKCKQFKDNLYAGHLFDKLKKRKSDRIKSFIKNNYRVPNGGLEVYFGEPRVDLYSRKTWSKYSKRWHSEHGAYVETIVKVAISNRMLEQEKIKYLFIDNLLTVDVYSIKKYQDYQIIYAKVLVQKNKRDITYQDSWTLEDMFIAIKGDYNYHSSSVSEAIKGVELKIKNIEKSKEEMKLTEETKITRKLYHKLTGACYAGIEQFVIRMGWQNRKYITVKKLLQVKEDFYGKDKIINMLKNNI